jgi:putative peptidoglycan lipid II flippase
MAILRNSLIVAVWTMASRGLGFARDLLIANRLGAGPVADAFFVALMLPNLLRRLFGEGAFNVAFVPILARHKGHNDRDAMIFASAAFSWLLLVVSVVTLLGILGMPVLITILASGWIDDTEKFALAVHLGRITFPYLGLITIAAFLGAMCNTWGQFSAYAMVPALLNLSILLCLFALPGLGAHPAEAAAWAVPLGGVAQAAYMIWAARRLGIRLRLQWLPRHPDLKKLLLRLGPATLGVGVLQLSILVDYQVASFLPSGAISYLQYANRFYQLPLALIGVAVATVLLPHLALLMGQGDRRAATQSFTSALGGCMALALGSCIAMFLLAPEMMHALLRHGELTEFAANAVAWAMMGYIAGLPGYILTKVTAPAFFAAEDPMSPVRASLAALGVNFTLNILFVVLAYQIGLEHVAHVGIAVATAIGGYVNAALQWRWLHQRGVLDIDRSLFMRELMTMLAIGTVMAAIILVYKILLPYPIDASLWLRLGWLACAFIVGGCVFILGLDRTGLLRISILISALQKRRNNKAIE